MVSIPSHTWNSSRQGVATQVAQERPKWLDGAVTTYETELRRPDREVRPVLMSGSPLFLDGGFLHSTIGSVIDTTKRHVLEERLRCSQKMEAAG
jgi:PAS domain-containing protein